MQEQAFILAISKPGALLPEVVTASRRREPAVDDHRLC